MENNGMTQFLSDRCLQVDDILFYFPVVQAIQNFKVKTESLPQFTSIETKAFIDIFLYLFVV